MNSSPVRTHTRLALAVAAAACLGAVLTLRARPRASATQAVAHPLASPPLLRRYTLEYDLDDATALQSPGDAGAMLDTRSTTRIRGVAVVSPVYGARADSARWTLRLEPTVASVRVADRELIASPDEARRMFGAAVVLVEGFADGSPRRIHERDGDPELARSMLRLLAIEIGHARRGDDAWEREETTAQGVLTARYAWRGDGASLERERGSFARLFAFRALPAHDARGAATFTFRGDGALETLTSEESLDARDEGTSMRRRMRLSMRLTRATTAEPLRDVTAFVPRAVGAAPQSASIAEQHLTQRVGDMTVDAMVRALMEHRAGARMPDHNQFFWRATGLLTRDPEAAQALVGVFRDAATSRAMRGLLLDMLSRTATPEGQRVLVSLLASPEAQGDARGYLLQRLGFVRRPVAEVIDAALAAGRDPATHDSAQYVIGALARALRADGRPDEARTLDALLAQAAERPSPAQVRHVVVALGNAGHDDATPTVVRLARSDSADVREAAARALGSIDGPRSTAALFAMLEDPSSEVQKLCLRALADRTLSAAQVASLEARVTAGHFADVTFADMTTFWRAQARQHRAAALACLEAMIARDISDGTTRATVYALLDTLRGASA